MKEKTILENGIEDYEKQYQSVAESCATYAKVSVLMLAMLVALLIYTLHQNENIAVLEGKIKQDSIAIQSYIQLNTKP